MVKKLTLILTTVFLSLIMVVPTFAMSYPNDLPVAPSDLYSNGSYIIFYATTEKYVLINFDTKNPTLQYDDQSYAQPSLMLNTSTKFKWYHLIDGVWTYKGEQTVTASGIGTIIADVKSFKYTTADVYDRNSGELVFPLPLALHQIVGAVAETEAEKLGIQAVGTMGTLTLCGVGCLALLMGLSLFGKVFQIFQVK